MHPDELHVPDLVVRRLVDEQFPRWALLPLRRVLPAGTVNAVFRLGQDLSVRLPLRADDPAAVTAWLDAEVAAAAELSTCCPFPTPTHMATGAPGPGYPLPWVVQTWLPGTVASEQDPSASDGLADDLVTLLSALRAADTRGRRFTGTGRGGVLSAQDDWLRECLRRSTGLIDVARARAAWAALCTVPRSGPDVMAHTDLVPGNVLVDGGRLVGVLDGGGFAPADPALDLVAGWHLLDSPRRDRLRQGLACSEHEWLRGAAWALAQALGLVWYYQDSHPTMAGTGRRTIEHVLNDMS